MSDLIDDDLAAEYALGVLEGAQAADAEQRLSSDANFANAVAQWRQTFGELDATAEPASPAPAVWDYIAANLTTPRPQMAQLQLAEPHIAEINTEPRETGSAAAIRRPWWDSLTFWRTTAFATAFASLIILVGASITLMQAPQTPVYVAILLTEDSNEPAALVNTFSDGRAELVPLRDLAAPEGRELQVWTLWDRSVGPRPIGLIPAVRTMNLNLDNLPKTGQGQLFEITLEPKGGSPTGRPTGPILMKGLTTRTL